MEILVSILIGIPLGILSSLAAWWILFRYIVPKIEFSPHISKYYFKNLGTRYRIKFRNIGKRGIIDIEVFPILRIKGLNPELPDNWLNITLTTSLNNNHISSLKEDRIISLLPEDTDKFKNPNFPDHIRKKYQSKGLNIEDLLSLDNKVKLVVQLFGYDEFSGARKMFISKPYTLKDIKPGTFDHKFTIDKTGLQIVERVSDNKTEQPH
ncbi:MAG: hypothetical protein COX19_15090 [Desulfobacterales bacterium CG23_combo_of_CG06-09_8_20_14_all_51_8]|nr:MAG: hypothetical protein COX19_15090 [Desulfobacterales bacterium CG23_combo_of_CG06-09_8_20_14_all_51_8]